MHRRIVRKWLWLGVLIWLASATAQAAQWVVSLPAVAHWVRPMLMPGDTLTVLLQPGHSPHHWALKPSQLKALARADRIVLVSAALEAPLYRWARAQKRPLIVWDQLPGITRLQGEGHTHDHAASAHRALEHAPQTFNPHLWLSPENGRALIQAVAQAQHALHPQSTVVAQKTHVVLARVTQLDREAETTLAPLRRVPYMVLHDAFAYFDHHYRLNKVGVIEPPAGGVGLKRLLAMRNRLQQAGVRCVLYPSHENPKLLHTLVRGLAVRTQAVDVLGWQYKTLSGWFRAIVKGYAQCLRPS